MLEPTATVDMGKVYSNLQVFFGAVVYFSQYIVQVISS